MATDYLKKDELMRSEGKNKEAELLERLEGLLSKAYYIENKVLPMVSKIADDQDEIEILQGKKDILQEIIRAAKETQTQDIGENTAIKLDKAVCKKNSDHFTLIDLYAHLKSIDSDLEGLDKAVEKLENRLVNFDTGLKQFEVELKEDFYND